MNRIGLYIYIYLIGFFFFCFFFNLQNFAFVRMILVQSYLILDYFQDHGIE